VADLKVNIPKLQRVYLLQPGNLGPDQSQYGGTGSTENPEDIEEEGPDAWRIRAESSTGQMQSCEVPNKDVGNKILGVIQSKRREFTRGQIGEEDANVAINVSDFTDDDESEAEDESENEAPAA
jgi:hypothetical protein